MKKENKDHDSLRIMETLFGPYFSKNKGLIEIRFIEKASGKCFSNFYHHFSDINDDVLSELRKLNFTHNIYFGVNPRPLTKEKKQTDIKNIVCFWADLDGKDFQNGKDDAFQSIKEFSPKPNIIVDSGNGYHAYWILKEPIINVDDDMRLEFKKVFSGVIRTLRADSHAINLDRIMRLPGTYNIKKEDPLECKIVSLSLEKTYSLYDFNPFKDERYTEPDLDINAMPDFGSNELIVRANHLEDAKEDVKNLEISSRHKNMIITGACLTGKEADKSRSGRDFSIIHALLISDYNYSTIRSIFLNKHLGCSDRIIEKGEDSLKWDTLKMLKLTKLERPELTREQQKILNIKLANYVKAEQKRIAINKFILEDLLSGKDPVGNGMRDKDRDIFYYFDSSEKWLMDVEGIDFYCFLRDRFGIAKKEKEEIIDAIRTEIWRDGKEVEAHKCAFFDEKNFILYVSDHNNGIFKIDGEKIEHVDNGTDGIFFEFNSDFTPFNIDVNNLAGINYFVRGKTKEKRIGSLVIPGGIEKLGFNWEKLKCGESYLQKFLIDRANFDLETENDLTAEEQKKLLVIHFYSLFFESIFTEKPIICFVGRKESGKSFIATSIGKILFGDKFRSRHMPDTLNDLRTILGENYYLVFDNLDHYVKREMANVLCVTATGGTVEKRKLYTDHDIVKVRPHIYLVITTREPKFKYDDLVSRLLLFNTKKIDRPISSSHLFKTLIENRDSIISEVLVNLSSIVKMLKIQSTFVPRCTERIADWETFVRKVAGGITWPYVFGAIMEKMSAEKDRFGLEDDYLYILLQQIIYEDKKPIEDDSASELYSMLYEKAEKMKIKNFRDRYKSHISIGKRIANIKDELKRAFDFDVRVGNKNQKLYSFRPKVEEEEEVIPETVAPDAIEPESAAKEDEKTVGAESTNDEEWDEWDERANWTVELLDGRVVPWIVSEEGRVEEYFEKEAKAKAKLKKSDSSEDRIAEEIELQEKENESSEPIDEEENKAIIAEIKKRILEKRASSDKAAG